LYPSAVFWENDGNPKLSEVLNEGKIYDIKTRCFIKGKYNWDGSRMEVEI